MIEAVPRRLRLAAAAATPLLSTVAIVLATSLPLYVGHLGAVMPQLGVVGVFFWSIYRPDLMSYSSAFTVGLVADLLTGAPLGITALAMIVVRHLVLAERRYLIGKPFHVLWLGFLLVALAAAALVWLAASLYLFTPLDIAPIIVQTLISALLFPPLAWLLARCQQLLPMPRGFAGHRG